MPVSKRQKLMNEYLKARKEAAALGLIPQEEAPQKADWEPTLPEDVRKALGKTWAVPDSAKPDIIAALLEAFYSFDTVVDEKGNEIQVKPPRKLLIELARTLRVLDQTQWERDHPESAKAKSGAPSVSVQMNIQAAAVLRGMVEHGELGTIGVIGEIPTPTIPSTPSNGRQSGEVEACQTLDSD